MPAASLSNWLAAPAGWMNTSSMRFQRRCRHGWVVATGGRKGDLVLHTGHARIPLRLLRAKPLRSPIQLATALESPRCNDPNPALKQNPSSPNSHREKGFSGECKMCAVLQHHPGKGRCAPVASPAKWRLRASNPISASQTCRRLITRTVWPLHHHS